MLRSDLFEVAPAPARLGGHVRLPRHVAPLDGEALVSWVAKLGAELGMTPRAFCRDAFGVDARLDPVRFAGMRSASMPGSIPSGGVAPMMTY